MTQDLVLTSNVKSEKEAISLVADTVRNPPQTPGEIIAFAQKNFALSGAITQGLQGILPLAGSVFPLASSIFSAFSSFGAPSLGEQIFSGLAALSEQISAEISGLKDYLTELSESATLKTIDLTLEGVSEVAKQESAVRVMIAFNQSQLAQKFEAERTRIYDEYTARVNAARSKYLTDIKAYIDETNAEISELYESVKAVLANKALALLSQAESQLRKIAAESDTAAGSGPEPVFTQRSAPEASESGSQALLWVGGIAGALYLLARKKR